MSEKLTVEMLDKLERDVNDDIRYDHSESEINPPLMLQIIAAARKGLEAETRAVECPSCYESFRVTDHLVKPLAADSLKERLYRAINTLDEALDRIEQLEGEIERARR